MPHTSRDRIKSAATALFADKGYAATHTSEICRRAGVTKPVLYYHFKSKEDLHRSLMYEACHGLLQEVAEAGARGATVEDKLVNVIAADFELTRRNPKLAGLVLHMLFAPKRDGSNLDFIQTGEKWLAVLERILKEAVRKGEIACRPAEVATALLGIDMIYSFSYLLRGRPALDRRLARRIVKLVLNGCYSNVTDR
jgi:AcrR family transcriptional regulator